VKRSFLTSALLILAVLVSVSACVAGPLGDTSGCYRQKGKTQPLVAVHGGSMAAAAACRALKSIPAKCGMRSFLQLNFVALRTFTMAAPLHCPAAIQSPYDSRIVVSSIGSPETDRGPPVS
jgi:hypothetical protein